MGRIFDAFKWTISRGKDSQNFLGARWIGWFLSKTRPENRRIWALRILSMSPHYFLDRNNPKYVGMSNDDYLSATFEALVISREDIYQKILKPYLKEDYVVLDYGCGPGFLSRVVAPRVKLIYGIDISSGAIECAKVLNSAENIEYYVADVNGLATIPNGSIDVVYSFAVIQHLTNEVFEIVLNNCFEKLKSDGNLILHIQLNDEVWKSEDTIRAGSTIEARLKYEIGLHCFGRSEAEHVEILTKCGFETSAVISLAELVPEMEAEVSSQRLLIASKRK